MDERTKQCRGCPHFDNCRVHWGKQCRERGGKRIPKFKSLRRAVTIPEEAIAVIIWKNGDTEFFMPEDLAEEGGQESA